MTETIEVNADTAPMFLALRDVFCAIADHIDACLPGETAVHLVVKQWAPTPAPSAAFVDIVRRAHEETPAPAKPKARRKPYSATQKAAAPAKVRKHQRRKHKHPVAAAAAESCVPHKTVMTWARAAGLVK